jgi:hypothetical protein
MKKARILITLILVLFALFIPLIAYADDGTNEALATDFFTWGALATYAGCTAATVLLTQFLKGLWPTAWPVQYLSYLIAFACIVLSSWALGTFSWLALILALFNAVLVSFSANGGYNNVTAAINNKNDTT